MAISAWCQ